MLQPGDSEKVIQEKLIGLALFFVGVGIGGYLGAGNFAPLVGLFASLSYFFFVIRSARAAIAKQQEE